LSINGGKIDRSVSKLATYLNYGGLGALAIAMLLTTADAILRYLFSGGIPGSYHLNEFLLVAMIALPLAKCQENQAHIRVDFLVARIPPKIFTIIELVTLSFALVLFAVATYTTGQGAIQSYFQGDYVLSTINYPKWPVRSFIPIGTGCLTLRLLLDVVTHFRALFRHPEL